MRLAFGMRRALSVLLALSSLLAAWTSIPEPVLVHPAPPARHEHDDGRTRVVALGDSLTAGYQLAPGASVWLDVARRELAADGVHVDTVNQGVVGDTAAQGLARVDEALDARPDLLVVALGTNDRLQHIEPARTAVDIAAIVAAAESRGVPVLVVDDLLDVADPMMADGIHPTAEGHARIGERMAPRIADALHRVPSPSASGSSAR